MRRSTSPLAKGERDTGLALKLLIAAFVVSTEVSFLLKMAPFGVEYVFSSVLVTVALLMQLMFAVRPDSPSPASAIVFIFNWLFLQFSPRLQLMNSHFRLINTSSVTGDGVLMTDLMCALFIAAYTLAYVTLQKRGRGPIFNKSDENSPATEPAPYDPIAILITVAICSVVVVIVGPYIAALSDSLAYGTGSTSSPLLLLGSKYFLFMPSAAFMILLNETVNRHDGWTFSRSCVLLLLLGLVAVTENPENEGRNALGPVYLGILLIGCKRWFYTFNRRMLLLISGMVLVFPFAGLLTHHSDLTFRSIADTIKDHYLELHYDAWANTYSTIEYVHRRGMAWGHQLEGTLLFFVPSAWWHGKAAATGIVLGRYLMTYYKMWFTNLSAPVVAEGYIDFGALGVIAYGLIFASLVHFLDRLYEKKAWYATPMAIYFSIFLLFALRGALMAAYAYGVGEMSAFITVLLLLSYQHKRGYRRTAIGARHQ